MGAQRERHLGRGGAPAAQRGHCTLAPRVTACDGLSPCCSRNWLSPLTSDCAPATVSAIRPATTRSTTGVSPEWSQRAASSVKDKEGLSYEKWAKRLQRYYERVEALLWPDLIVVGGGVSKDSDKFLPLIDISAEMVPAKLRNTAGIVGAAWLAANRLQQPALVREGVSESALVE